MKNESANGVLKYPNAIASSASTDCINDQIPAFDTKAHGYFGIDIGGSLCKICFYQPFGDDNIDKLLKFIFKSSTYGSTGQRDDTLNIRTQHGIFHFILFETRRMESAVSMIINADLFNEMSEDTKYLPITGGGAHKFASQFEQFGVRIKRVDEMKSLLSGLNFLLANMQDECFYYPIAPSHPGLYDELNQPERKFIDVRNMNVFPYILVNIGTGTSILKVESDGSYQRISGSGLGGGTYWGLTRLLTQASNFDKSLELCLEGKTRNVDMTVGDIYGGDYTSFGLPADMTASFFAKFVSRENEHLRDNVSDADICRGLLLMITNNIGQISYLLAKLHNAKHIFFSGNFLRHSANVAIAPIALSKAISFWSNNEMRALFLKHEGYYGSMGAFLDKDAN